jgi:hypothetical protein
MASIHPIFTFPGEKKWSHPCNSAAELAATTRRNVTASLVVEIEILLVFKSHVCYFIEQIMRSLKPILAQPSECGFHTTDG